MPFIVASFYHFFDFPDFANRRVALLKMLKENNLKGSILIAAEGINGTLSGTRDSIDAALRYMKEEITGGDFDCKESPCETQPFGRAKVRLKKEVISLGEAVSRSRTGAYVDPKNWNALISDPDTILIDARNRYETHLGGFENALDPKTRSFKELPAFVRKNLVEAKRRPIATYCTGGIRCEKFSAWLIAQGFDKVYQLKGGILKYLEEIPAGENKFRGECYVFDERVAVGHGLAPSSTASMCKACGHALTEADRKHSLYIENERCFYCSAQPG